MTFNKLPSGNWRTRTFVNGKQHSFTGKTKKEAEQKAVLWMATHSDDEDMDITLDEATQIYINSRQAVLSPTTLHSYDLYHQAHFQPLMDTKINSIKVTDIQEQINALSLEKSPKTVKNVVSFYLAVLDYNEVYIPKKKLRYPQRKHLEYATPDGERIKQIMAATKDTEIEIPVLLAVWCSLRLGEVLGLKWDKITEDHITIDNTRIYYGGRTIEKAPKTTDSTRTIPMPRYIWERLKMMPKNGEYVVSMSGSAIRHKFHRVLEANNIPDCRFHDLRHANASVMLTVLNIPSKVAQKRGGWATPKVMNDVYNQVFNSEEQIAAQKLDNYFEAMI